MSTEPLTRAFASTKTVLAGVSPDQLGAPTPCASWDIRAIVNHVVGGTTFFAQVAETGEFTPPPGEAPDLAAGDFKTAYAEGSERAVAAFSAPGVMEKTMKLPFGEMPGSAFLLVAATDNFTHGWDLAKATGQSTDLDPQLAEQLLGFAQGAIPDAWRGPEPAPFGPVVDAPADAPAADRLAAFLGRQP
jgi:uncharacterized protein (TIGR03086 family)